MAVQTERLDMRLSPEHKKFIEQAASLNHQAVSAWVKFVLLSEAQEVIDTHKRIVLSRKNWDAFLDIVDSDDEPIPDLRRAVKRYKGNRVGD